MSTIHIYRASQATVEYKNSIALLSHNDAVILLDDAVYLAKHPILNVLIKAVSSKNVFILEEHAFARGITPPHNVTPINLASFPALILSFNQSITWQ